MFPSGELEVEIGDRYRIGMKRSLGFILTAVFLFGAEAAAHPHVWVTGQASFQIEDTKLTRVGMRWQFDAFFSQVLGSDFDTNGDGVFDDAETQAMKEQVFTSLRDFGYFTHIRTSSGEKRDAFESVENFSIGQDKGEMIFEFDLVLADPLDPSQNPVGLSLYDPTIYVDLILGGDAPVEIAGGNGLGCALEYREGDEVTSQSVFIVPQEVWLNCAGS